MPDHPLTLFKMLRNGCRKPSPIPLIDGPLVRPKLPSKRERKNHQLFFLWTKSTIYYKRYNETHLFIVYRLIYDFLGFIGGFTV